MRKKNTPRVSFQEGSTVYEGVKVTEIIRVPKGEREDPWVTAGRRG